MRGSNIGVGTDLVSVDEVRGSLRRFGRRYLERVFTPGEIADCADEPERLAARFAAKEAAMKALSLGGEAIPWIDIEVVRAPTGAPRIALHRAALALARRRRVRGMSLSLTHEASYASAVVLAERRNPDAPRRSRRATRRT